MKYLISILVLLLAAHDVDAKCIGGFITFSGKVVDRTGAALPGAAVGISWSEYEGIAGPALGMTDTQGMYVIPVAYSAYSGKGKIYEDSCDFRLKSVSISAYKDGMMSPRRRIRLVASKALRLPTLKVFLTQDKESSVRFIMPKGS